MEEFSEVEKLRLMKAAQTAVDNQTKMVDAAMIAAKAFEKLVDVIAGMATVWTQKASWK